MYQGNDIRIERNKTRPAKKSITLAGSFGIPPKNDFINNRAPTTKKTLQGRSISDPNIKIIPATKSIAPSILTTIYH